MIFVLGYPKELGGANTELWHVLRLWRRHGLEITVIPTWEAQPEWVNRLDGIGCCTLCVKAEELPGLLGQIKPIVVAFCNVHFLEMVHKLQDAGCRLVWVPCMCWPFPAERLHLRHYPPFDRYVFHTDYQRAQLVPYYRKGGYEDHMGTIIRGAFFPEDFPLDPRPHKRGERFIVGRLSRVGPDKFPRDLWAQYGKIPHPTSARVMGWEEKTRDKCGGPPTWAEVLAEKAETSRDFLSRLHALVPGIGCCAENWPRVGLEAMAAGVPIVADSNGGKSGWNEMLAEGGGLLADSVEEQAYLIARLAWDEQFRMGVITDAHWRMEQITDEQTIWGQWEELFKGLGYERRRTAAAVSVAC